MSDRNPGTVPRVPLTLRLVRNLVVPTEHGSWSFLLEPAMLGILVMPGLAGVLVLCAALAAFLSRRPLRTWLDDSRREQPLPRTRWALRLAITLLGAAAIAGLGATLVGNPWFWLPVACAVPGAGLALRMDVAKRGREALGEAVGVASLAAAAPAILLSGSVDPVIAAAAWLAVLLRGLPTLAYVRARLRLDKGQPAGFAVPLLAHVAAVATAAAVSRLAPVHWSIVVPYVLLAARCAWGLSPWRWRSRAQILGAQEAIAGVLAMGWVAFALTTR